mmetsp:Transcript_2514/g.6563  ORF Transcript_2514/g.6563 Transcript_2514/m.6563 type:complete len:409 (+) Transcript_2514:140-1366(+)|eukprot:jgi/Tetstr1/462740/TSEL_000700.t2
MSSRQGLLNRQTPQQSKFQQKRRDDALARQRSARQVLARRARDLEEEAHKENARQASDAGSEGAGVRPARTESRPKPHEFWSSQLMHPEWLLDIPDTLSTDWFISPRPEGARCIVVASKGVTTSRARSGLILHQFQSRLPGGSRLDTSGAGACVLDCIYHEANATYYVVDMMVWKGHSLYDCTTEFRLFWVATKLLEDSGTELPQDLERQGYPFSPLTSFNCSQEALEACRSGAVPFTRDGILFRHKDAHYTPGHSPSPLNLVWKDGSTSRYFLDTDAAGVVLEHQMVVLEYRMDQTVATSDGPPVVLGKLPQDFVTRLGAKLKVGSKLRFSIRDGGIQFCDGQAVGADLRFEGLSNPRRGRVDFISKILFQYFARRDPLTFEKLTLAVAPSLSPSPADSVTASGMED